VDDGSTDDSLNILNMYAMFDERLKVIHQENAGAAAARNRGLMEAKGEFISVLDSDDFFHPEMLEKMVAKAEEDNSDVVVCGWFQFFNELQKDAKKVKIPEEYVKKSPLNRLDLGKDLFLCCANAPWNKLIRSEFLKENKILFDASSRVCDDVYFSLCVVGLAEKISLMSDAFVYYRENPKGQTASMKDEVFSFLCQTLSKTYLRLKESCLPYELLSVFNHRVKKSFVWWFQYSKKENIKSFLISIKRYLHPDLYGFLFDSSKPKVSVIIPVYNTAEFLHECLDSCLNQTLKEIEIICVDDGSTDNSLEILNDYAKRDNRIIVLQQQNQRQAIARNKAMDIATGKYIQFLDSDDYLDLNTCECLYLYSQIHDLDMLFFSAIEFQNETREEFEEPYHCLRWLPENFISVFSYQNLKEIMMSVAVTACLTFYRKDFLNKNNIKWIEKKLYYEDSPFFVESFLKAQRVGAIKQKFYHRRVHKKATTQNMSENFLDYCEICRLTLKLAKKYGDDIVFSRLFYGYIRKSYLNYLMLTDSVKIKYVQNLLNLYTDLKNEYALPLPDEIEEMLENMKKTH
jgi:glycosyltransferase involved in cell wall biosynthesis